MSGWIQAAMQQNTISYNCAQRAFNKMRLESSTVTSEFGGKFKDKNVKREFLDYIRNES